jgi:hypothetical protein
MALDVLKMYNACNALRVMAALRPKFICIWLPGGIFAAVFG